jgi:hypothetical protein
MLVNGKEARLFRYDGSDDFVAAWSESGYGLLARGAAPDLAAFTALVGTLHEANVDAWLSAMPQSVVKPNGRSKVVLDMLDGVPLPPGFDVAPLLRGDDATVVDRYQLGAQVAGAVACAWIDRWIDAKHTDDTVGVQQAVRALTTSHDWRVLHDMQAEGEYSPVLWSYADAVAADAPTAEKQSWVEDTYRSSLGCPAG